MKRVAECFTVAFQRIGLAARLAHAQAGLALPRAVPPNAVYRITPNPGTTIRVNPVTSPQFGQPGGLPEFQFPLGTGPGTVSGPTLLP